MKAGFYEDELEEVGMRINMYWSDRHTKWLSQNPKNFFGKTLWRVVLTKNQRKRINRKAKKQVI